MSIVFNNASLDHQVHIIDLNIPYQCDNFNITISNKGGCIISNVDNLDISLHCDLCVLIGAYYDSFIDKVNDVFAFYDKEDYQKEMTEKNRIYLKTGFIHFEYNNNNYSLDLNKLVVSSDVFCTATQAELKGVQENV
jgi:hypothetical protein